MHMHVYIKLQAGSVRLSHLAACRWGLSDAQERFWFCMAPANLRSPSSAAALMHYAKKYAARQPVSADITFREKMPTTPEELCELEAAHQVLCHKPQKI